MTVIYQIGRLDQNIGRDYKFSIGEQVYAQPLSSFALKEHFGWNHAKVILVYPVSLPFNRNIPPEYGLDNDLKERYLQDPYPFFQRHPHAEKADGFVVVHSLGTYDGQRFDGNYDAIVLSVFMDMVRRFLEAPFERIYMDISSWHNIYVTALIEAVRYFAVFWGLQSWHCQRVLRAFLCFTEPISDPERVYQIYHDKEIRHRAFFEAPILVKDESERNGFVKKLIGEEDRELKRTTQQLLRRFLVCYSAIINNTPMVFYSFPDIVDKEDEVTNLILKLVRKVQNLLARSWTSVPDVVSHPSALKNWRDLIFCFALYRGTIRLLLRHGVIREAQDDGGVELERMQQDFLQIYDTLGVPGNGAFLRSEISNLRRKVEEEAASQHNTDSWITLGRPSDPDLEYRNFVAHVGLQRTITEFRAVNGKFYARYKNNNDLKARIEHTLLEAL